MKPLTRKYVKFPSKTNNIKAKDKKYLKNWWEDIAEYSKAVIKNKWKEEIKEYKMNENTSLKNKVIT